MTYVVWRTPGHCYAPRAPRGAEIAPRRTMECGMMLLLRVVVSRIRTSKESPRGAESRRVQRRPRAGAQDRAGDGARGGGGGGRSASGPRPRRSASRRRCADARARARTHARTPHARARTRAHTSPVARCDYNARIYIYIYYMYIILHVYILARILHTPMGAVSRRRRR